MVPKDAKGDPLSSQNEAKFIRKLRNPLTK